MQPIIKSLRLIANYVYRLADKYNSFYQNIPVLTESDKDIQNMRLSLSAYTAKVIKHIIKFTWYRNTEKM